MFAFVRAQFIEGSDRVLCAPHYALVFLAKTALIPLLVIEI
jgi:hypothetical protein